MLDKIDLQSKSFLDKIKIVEKFIQREQGKDGNSANSQKLGESSSKTPENSRELINPIKKVVRTESFQKTFNSNREKFEKSSKFLKNIRKSSGSGKSSSINVFDEENGQTNPAAAGVSTSTTANLASKFGATFGSMKNSVSNFDISSRQKIKISAPTEDIFGIMTSPENSEITDISQSGIKSPELVQPAASSLISDDFIGNELSGTVLENDKSQTDKSLKNAVSEKSLIDFDSIPNAMCLSPEVPVINDTDMATHELIEPDHEFEDPELSIGTPDEDKEDENQAESAETRRQLRFGANPAFQDPPKERTPSVRKTSFRVVRGFSSSKKVTAISIHELLQVSLKNQKIANIPLFKQKLSMFNTMASDDTPKKPTLINGRDKIQEGKLVEEEIIEADLKEGNGEVPAITLPEEEVQELQISCNKTPNQQMDLVVTRSRSKTPTYTSESRVAEIF